ncbi:PRTRC genetic system ThiF family protein [Bacteroides reticulotermitis]|uniref:PRTRC genetic system ThiF family protein n=1 Tax=Bacteroides reticulotermitis TaxID=1133319 RepID=A0A840DAY4_9BACE|nr:PRTRC system ThiF family protein [Bacteroides reticulotermitis]MBB4045815.1 PRTRC genetic system ThiF family protein [Bacteroides reticulotermitis]
MRKIHYTDSYLLSPYHPVTIFVIGAGGTGSQVITNLARMDLALQALGHPGLHVTVFDPDIITEANIGRQLFSEAELGQNKAMAIATRINSFFGSIWMAESCHYPLGGANNKKEPMLANIIITCTDNIRSRLDLWKFLKEYRNMNVSNEKTPIYWMDFGNAQITGQVLIGNIRNKIPQPASGEYIPMPKMNVITEEVSYSTVKEMDSGPSCSLAEALEKQDLFINSILAQVGCDILWKMFKEGRTLYRGAYVNLDTLRVNPIPV